MHITQSILYIQEKKMECTLQGKSSLLEVPGHKDKKILITALQ